MSVEKRPYVGNWTLNGKKLVQHTPDAMVYINGDTSVPGCAKCNGKIDIQQFLTEVSVDAGTEPGSASASFTLSIPLHHTDSFARDAKFIFHPGLEVHVYMRGYFPVKGLYQNLAEAQALNPLAASSAPASSILAGTVLPPSAIVPPKIARGFQIMRLTPLQQQNAELIYSQILNAGYSPAFAAGAILQSFAESGLNADKRQGNGGPGLGLFQVDPGGLGGATPAFQQGRAAGTADTPQTWNALDASLNIDRELLAFQQISALRNISKDETATIEQSFMAIYGSPAGLGVRNPSRLPKKNKTTYYTLEEWQAKWDRGADRRSRMGRAFFGSAWTDAAFSKTARELGTKEPEPVETAFQPADVNPITQGTFGPSLLEEKGLAGMGIENTLAYPYYPVFHGVVTDVNHSYTSGVNTVTIQCSSMLHFWQYHNMSTSASVFGARPTNSKNKVTLVGNNFSGMHPYAIMYSLHYDMAGAAGGVGWALDSKSNAASVSQTGDSLYSLNILYWEKRFRRGTRLRMHGATGELFSTMAATWLGRQSSAVLTRALRQRYNVQTFGQTDIGSQMKAVGLWSGTNTRNAIDATRFAAQQKAGNEKNSPNLELNVLEMQAFVSNIGEWGQVNLFESTYQSKLDIANMVTQVTGFEFFQDVDGDFVFKPPMWNLDTSTSRVYRIEDIDIVNISFQEKEPQCTYMVVKGSQFKDLQGTGMDNEWGVRGQYIDYRLVAQFGWRLDNFDTSYFNDPKAMFSAAVNRMDVLNVGVNSCTLTIPVRPELRPGYPVYIPYLDCFYYVAGFSHSHSVGGTCSTNLNLVGKRAKFFAPGEVGPGTKGIEAIHLGDTTLPERPLVVLDSDGKPRLSGFPNVVMALDPTAVNPLFFVVGTDIESFSDVRVVKYLLQQAVQLGILHAEDPNPLDGRQYYTMTRTLQGTNQESGSSQEVRFFFDEGDLSGAPQGGDINILAAALEYDSLLQGQNASVSQSWEQLAAKQAELTDIQSQINTLRSTPQPSEDVLQKLDSLTADLIKGESEKSVLAQSLSEQNRALEASWQNKPGVGLLLDVYRQTSEKYRLSADFQGRGDLSNTANLLDMLSDKKATFSNGQQPGQYRYFSASHPLESEQGPRTITYNGKKIDDGAPLAITEREPPEVDQYVMAPTASAGLATPEAQLQRRRPKVGIRVLTGTGKARGEVLATSEITELMFSVQDVSIAKRVTNNTKRAKVAHVGKALEKRLAEVFSVDAPSGGQSARDLFSRQWDSLVAVTTNALSALNVAGEGRVSNFVTLAPAVPVFPSSVTVGVGAVDTTLSFNSYKYLQSPGTQSLGARIGNQPLGVLVSSVGVSLAQSFYKQLGSMKKDINTLMVNARVAPKDRDNLLAVFNEGFSIGAPAHMNTTSHAAKDASRQDTVFSPVFPVSDAQGYHVIGSYRYGRGVDIDPEGVFDQLHKQDIFSLLDRTTVDQIIRVFVQNGKISVPDMQEIEMVGGKKKTVPQGRTVEVGGAAAAKYLNGEVLRQLRAANLTDSQILDYSHALSGGTNPGSLEFSLANIFTSQMEGTQKIPVVNAAYSLADLNLQQSGHVCACKAAEASMLLTAFGQEEFVEFEGTTGVDAATKWVQTQAEIASVEWEQQQQALRGQVLDNGRHSNALKAFSRDVGLSEGTNILEQASNSTTEVKQLLKQTQARRNQLEDKL